MIRVGFDRQTFIIQKHGGISRYFADLYMGLNEQNEVNANLLFEHHRNNFLREQGVGKRIHPIWARAYNQIMPRIRWELPISRDVDIHHSTYYFGNPKKRLGASKLASTLHDMIPELHPQYFKRNPHANKAKWLSLSDLIISVSQASATDLEYFYPKLSPKIRRIHLYSGFNEKSPQRKPRIIKEQKNSFYLFTGNRGAYKNALFLLRAFAASEPKKHGNVLIFAGGGAFRKNEQQIISMLKLENYVFQLNVNDAELWYLYRNASAVLVPSLAEGFSLPLVEGLAANAPVICSDIPVHREVAKDFALMLNPLQPDDWADILKEVGRMPSPSQTLGTEIYRQKLHYFSRDRMVSEHVQVYKELTG